MTEQLPRRLDQSMAADAARAVPDPLTEELSTRLDRLPTMLRSSGLAATLAFLHGKSRTSGNDKQRAAYQQVSHAMVARLAGRLRIEPLPTPAELLNQLAEADLETYALASAEARAFAGWLQRIAAGRTCSGANGEAVTG